MIHGFRKLPFFRPHDSMTAFDAQTAKTVQQTYRKRTENVQRIGKYYVFEPQNDTFSRLFRIIRRSLEEVGSLGEVLAALKSRAGGFRESWYGK